jgi:TolB-like protein/Tfp pilus assembly protein PilF
MEVTVPFPRTFRFGPFEFEARTGELRRHGGRIRLRRQTSRLLGWLLASPGVVLTRQELQQRLWPAGTFVDFEAGLNTAIRRLRQALGESAHNPRYVETLPQGYRFTSAVEGPHPGPITSLAVLPFEDLTGSPDLQVFASAVTDALTTHLAEIAPVRVVSRTSARHYAGTTTSLPVIAQELRVDALVEGAVVRSGHGVRITVRLIHATTDQHVWAQSYERDTADDVGVARTMAERMADTLRPWRTVTLMLRRPVDPKARQAYLKGRHLLTRQTSPAYVRALGCFYEAVAREPRYALAYAGLSDCYRLLAFLGPWPPSQCMPRAEAFARKALELEETLVEARASLAAIAYRFRHDWSASEREFRNALSLDPAHADVRRTYAIFLTAAGRLDEAISEVQHVGELQPGSPDSALGWALLWGGDPERAVETFRGVCEADGGSAMAHLGLGSALAAQGCSARSIRELTRAVELSNRTPVYLARLAHAHASAGNEGPARAILSELQRRGRRRYVSPVALALVHVGLGDRGRALDLLEEAYRLRDFDLATWNPRFNVLGADPRFQDIMRRVRPPR